jgi:hypothetical protein
MLVMGFVGGRVQQLSGPLGNQEIRPTEIVTRPCQCCKDPTAGAERFARCQQEPLAALGDVQASDEGPALVAPNPTLHEM